MSIVSVSNSSELMAALRAAEAGDTISLEGGNYGGLNLRNVHFSDAVVITSASKENPAIFSSVRATKVSNLTFDGVEFVVSDKDAPIEKPFYFNSTSDVTVRDVKIVGKVDADGHGKGHGIWAIRSDGFTLEDSELVNFNVAAYLRRHTDLVVRDTDFSNVAWDAMIVGGVHDAVIEGNAISLNIEKGTKHTDGIQFWNTGENDPSSDVIVRGNTIVTNNTASHGIFAGNKVSREIGSDGAFENFLIEDNVVIGGQVAGIHVGETSGLVIRNNVVMQDVAVTNGSLIRTPTIRVDEASTGVVITDNVVHRAPAASDERFLRATGTPSDWTISSDKGVPLGTIQAEIGGAGADVFRLETRGRGEGAIEAFDDNRGAPHLLDLGGTGAGQTKDAVALDEAHSPALAVDDFIL